MLGTSRYIFRGAAVALLAALLAACAGGPQLTEVRKARLLERAEARWRALEQRDFDTAWTYTSPAYREVFPKAL